VVVQTDEGCNLVEPIVELREALMRENPRGKG